MALARGVRLGPYEVTDLIGVGGMGEVWRAVDTSLGRPVAIKVLPDTLAHDPERLARFEREARTLGALNHPNLATVYGLVNVDGLRAIVMELVDGQTLADRVATGPIPYEEALPLAKQVAEALEAAHEQAIVHRDLKPSNVMVRPEGTVKVLDFGLAKALDPAEPSANVSQSPTITSPAVTKAGVVLGTAAYMAPEQAKGRTADRRADIWAFGATVFEMITGTRAFHGEDVPETLAAILTKEPDWPKLPAPASALRPLLQRCLKKDPKQRLQAIGDARIQVDELMSGSRELAPAPPVQPHSLLRRAAPAALAAVAASALTGALLMWGGPARSVRSAPAVSRFEIVPPAGETDFVRAVAISPDGRHIVSADPPRPLAVRPMDGLDIRRLSGTEGANQPFFSADSRWIGFFQNGSLRRVPTSGGAPITICQTGAIRGATWSDDGSIAFATLSGELVRIPAGSCEPTGLVRFDPAAGQSRQWFPSLLPGGRGILFTKMPPNRAESAQVAVLDSKTGQQKTLIGGSQAEYVETGHLVYAAANTLRAVRFDLERLEVLGEPVTVVDELATAANGAAQYGFSRTGTLVYAVPRPQARSLVWVDRKGQESPIPVPVRAYIEPRLSPDDTRLAVAVADQEHDIWMWDLKRGGALARFTSDPSPDGHPIWTADGQRIVFASLRSGAYNLYAQAADGTGSVERLTAGPHRHIPGFVLPDRTGIIGTEIAMQGDIVWFKRPASPPALDASPGSSLWRVEPLINTSLIEFSPDVSPDRRFIAYQSQEAGRSEVLVRPLPKVDDGRWQVSIDGGSRPRWARNGRELFYLDEANRLTAVQVQTSGRAFVHGSPRTVLATAYAGPFENAHPYDVTADGRRFVMIKEDATAAAARRGLTVVLNWFEELKTKVP